MSNARFFASVSDQKAILEPGDTNHAVHVLRLGVGDAVSVCDGAGLEYPGTITQITGGRAEVSVDPPVSLNTEAGPAITLFVALSKGDKLEAVIQKAVELGVTQIGPFVSKRCVAKPPAKKDTRLDRWNKIAREAARQCGRGRVPTVTEILTFGEALTRSTQADVKLFCYENATYPLSQALNARPFSSVSLLTGPEGGFEDDEVQLASAFGLAVVSLGARVLRCETAPLYALSCIDYHYGCRADLSAARPAIPPA